MSIFKDHFPRIGASGQSTGYEISNAVRLNAADTAKLIRNVDTTYQAKWCFSTWFKLAEDSGGQENFFHWVDKNETGLNGLYYISGGSTKILGCFEDNVDNSSDYAIQANLNREFRDYTGWYHVVFVHDPANSAQTERFKIYINGERQFSYSQPYLVSGSSVGNGPQSNAPGSGDENYLCIGGDQHSSQNEFNGYLAETQLIDGFAYDASYFGEFTDNGIWIPKKYSGTYPYESFYLKYTNSGNFGEDFSGNDHDFTPTNLSAHDQVTDTPTNNFTVMAPTMVNSAGSVARNAGFDEGNLEVTNTSTTADFVAYNMLVPASFKSYYEIYVSHSGGSGAFGGGNNNRIMVLDGESLNSSTTWAVSYNEDGSATGSGESSQSVAAFEHGDIIGIAVDMSANVRYYRNGSLLFTMAVGASYQSLTHMLVIRIMQSNSKNPTFIMNFGQEGTFLGNKTAQGNSDENDIGNFFYSPPSGHLAICTKNLGA